MKLRLPIWLAALVTGLLSLGAARADVTLPSLFASHMVLQQDQPIIVWGWADPGETVTVQLDASQISKTTATADGEWQVTLPAMKADGDAHTLVVSSKNTLKFDDVLIGEVWICSGQSNMELGVKVAKDGDQEAAAADYPQIRLFLVPKTIAATPQRNVDATWKVCTPSSITEGGWGGFTAAGYYFGRELNKTLKVPIGLIESDWGGTRIDAWTPPAGFAGVPALKSEYDAVELADPSSDAHKTRLTDFLGKVDAWSAAARSALQQNGPVAPMPEFPQELKFDDKNPQTASGLYNGMIHPLVPFAFRGAIWYQGEANVWEGSLYTDKMKALITGWRQTWNEGDFPFYYVQIAPFIYGNLSDSTLPKFWRAQTDAQAIPNTGMVVVNDIGNLTDIHPKNKQEVGRRLALWALAKTYHQSGIIAESPEFKSLHINGGQVVLTFDHAGAGLKSRDGQPLNSFEIIDRDFGGFVPATAEITGPDTITVSADSVTNPVAVRFDWSQRDLPNLSSAEGLPANCFQAGDIPKRDQLSFIPEAKDFQLVYDLDLKQLSHDIHYTVDNHTAITGTIDRIAYLMELQDANDNNQYVYVSLDPFTTDLSQIGVPTVASGAKFQTRLAHLNVFSNVEGVKTGSGLKGNIEFWPNNYGQANSAAVPGASDATFDFGDQPTDPADGYGSMQIHNYAAAQTLFAINHWSAGDTADLGLGNQKANNPDWTFANNANSYHTGRLRVLVHVK